MTQLERTDTNHPFISTSTSTACERCGCSASHSIHQSPRPSYETTVLMHNGEVKENARPHDLAGAGIVGRVDHRIMTEEEVLDSLTPAQHEHRDGELAAENVRRMVILPHFGMPHEQTSRIRDMLAVGTELTREWAELDMELAGQLTHAAPELFGSIVNACQHASKALELLWTTTGRVAEWRVALNSIAHLAVEEGAWRLAALASTALSAGPFTATWGNAIDALLGYWDRKVEA